MLHYDKLVPYEGPDDAKILFVGEAPGEDEHDSGKPFMGTSGQLLMNCLNRNGLNREDVKLANLLKVRPINNKFEAILNAPILREHLKELYDFIATINPNVIVPLGSYPLLFLTGRKGIMKWRGSILSYVHRDIKVIPTIHPAAVARDRKLYPTFDIDIQRIVRDSKYPEKNLPNRKFIIRPSGMDCEEWVQKLESAIHLGIDIETVKNSTRILCVGFSPSPDLAVCFVPSDPDGSTAIQRLLESKARKVFQFGTFDVNQLRLNGFRVIDEEARRLDRPYYWDTNQYQHASAPELPRSLEYLTSIYTREPYYKTVGRGSIPDDEKGWSEKTDKQTLYEYNCRDCCVTIEIAQQQMIESMADKSTSDTFNYEMSTLEVAWSIMNAGMLVDEERRTMIEGVLLDKWARKQFVLDRLTGFETNVRSPLLKKILYDHLGLPPRYKDKVLTTEEDAIVSLIGHCKDKVESYKTAEKKLEWNVKLSVCQLILEIRGIRVVLSNYIRPTMKNGKTRIRDDGRIHSTYKVAGTETGRWSASKFVDGTGLNSQTLPRDPLEVPTIPQAIQPTLLSQLDEEKDIDEVEQEEAA